MAISIDFLRTVSLFSFLDDTELTALATAADQESLPAGKHVFHMSESGDSMYVIETGRIELSIRDTTGDKIILAEMGSMEVFGEMALFDPGPRSATATVLEDATCVVLHRDDILRFLTAHPTAALDLLAVMARRLRETDHLLMGRVTRNLNAEFEEDQTWVQIIASWIAAFSGSMLFVFLNAMFFLGWIVVNLSLIPGVPAFDPYPFGFLTMSVSLEAIFLSIFVLLAQNLQSAKERLRSDVEYQINLKAELEIAELHGKVTQLHLDITRRLSALEKFNRSADRKT
jgi:uncharacterized membrane protein